MYNYLYNVVVIIDHNNNAGINVKTEGGGGMGKGAAFECFGIFWVKFPTLGTGK